MDNRKQIPPVTVARYLRNHKGLSMDSVANELGLSFQTLFNAEQGGQTNLNSLRKLASFYHVTLDCLARNDLAAAATQLFSPAIHGRRMKALLREKQKMYDEIGDRGERLVIERERARLAGTPFAMAVNGNVSEDVTAGFDALSFDEYGKPIYIEAKTTVGGEDTPFYMSRRELEFLRTCYERGDNYQLHRLYDLNEADHCGTKILTAEELLHEYEFIPVSYLVRRCTI